MPNCDLPRTRRWGCRKLTVRWPLASIALVWIFVAPIHAQSRRAPSARRAAAAGAPAATPPNVLLIVADDLGYADLGVQGATDVRTPNIDAVARQGVRFSDAYMVSSLCAPSRAGMLTGRYPQRWGHEFNPPRSDDSTFGIPRDVPTLAERLKSLGYRTGLVGKWHLGFVSQQAPNARGFDEFFGFMGPSHRYDRNQLLDVGEKLMRNGTVIPDSGYLTDVLGIEAERFVRAKDRRPFFLYLAFSAMHGPLYADPPHLARAEKSVPEGVRRTYVGVLAAMDDAVGRVLDALDETGQAANTLVLFVSDNGGDLDLKAASNAPLRGRKGQLYEGGIRVPFFVRWPGHVTAGATYTKPISALDIVPTVTAAAGREPEPGSVDGVNLLPYLSATAGRGEPHASLFWRIGSASAARMGQWKLVVTEKGSPALFDLAADIGERRDVSSANGRVLAGMQRAYAAWVKEQQPPRWGHDPTEPTLRMRIRRFIAKLFSGK
ncbi:MAG: Arylsulfatase [Gemmatimonadaceae bacterium]|nr:Arylsulfatase [Gemmatimonadaceae bacterium]